MKSPSSSDSFFAVYFSALVRDTNCLCLSALLALPPTLLESPILPRETAAASGETEQPRSSAAFPVQCCYKPCLAQGRPWHKGTKPHLHSQKGTTEAR